jgi:hypothetical protein
MGSISSSNSYRSEGLFISEGERRERRERERREREIQNRQIRIEQMKKRRKRLIEEGKKDYNKIFNNTLKKRSFFDNKYCDNLKQYIEYYKEFMNEKFDPFKLDENQNSLLIAIVYNNCDYEDLYSFINNLNDYVKDDDENHNSEYYSNKIKAYINYANKKNNDYFNYIKTKFKKSNKNKNTSLIWAAKKNNIKSFFLLLKSGANLNIKNIINKTAFYYLKGYKGKYNDNYKYYNKIIDNIIIYNTKNKNKDIYEHYCKLNTEQRELVNLSKTYNNVQKQEYIISGKLQNIYQDLIINIDKQNLDRNDKNNIKDKNELINKLINLYYREILTYNCPIKHGDTNIISNLMRTTDDKPEIEKNHDTTLNLKHNNVLKQKPGSKLNTDVKHKSGSKLNTDAKHKSGSKLNTDAKHKSKLNTDAKHKSKLKSKIDKIEKELNQLKHELKNKSKNEKPPEPSEKYGY